jgi:hypothetical protein
VAASETPALAARDEFCKASLLISAWRDTRARLILAARAQAIRETRMKIAMLGCAGFFLGAIVGGTIGIGLGFLWIEVFQTTSFEGYSGMLVFFTFMPIGIAVGAIAGAVGLGFLASRADTAARSGSVP